MSTPKDLLATAVLAFALAACGAQQSPTASPDAPTASSTPPARTSPTESEAITQIVGFTSPNPA